MSYKNTNTKKTRPSAQISDEKQTKEYVSQNENQTARNWKIPPTLRSETDAKRRDCSIHTPTAEIIMPKQRNLCRAVSVSYLCRALLANIRRFCRRSLVDVYWILSTVFAKMPLINLTSPNVLHHFPSSHPLLCHPRYFSIMQKK